MDVHSISELQTKNVPVTDDSPKYNYKALQDDGDGGYRKSINWSEFEIVISSYILTLCLFSPDLEFEFCQAKIVAIRCPKEFAEQANEGQLCSLILDKTCFYAEQGGQIYDEGDITIEDGKGLVSLIFCTRIGWVISTNLIFLRFFGYF